MKHLLHLSFAVILLAGVTLCFFKGIEKQSRINDLYGWRCCHEAGASYRNIDIQKSGG